MTRRPHLEAGATTHVGLVRAANEDAMLAADGLFLVADGMGGHLGGAVASALVVEAFEATPFVDPDPHQGMDLMSTALTQAHQRIRAWGEAHRTPGARYAGTTVSAALAVEEAGDWRWLVANLGDSRVYRFSAAAGLDQVSIDHSVVQQLIDAGRITPQEAETHAERHVITRALGSPEGVHPDFFVVPLIVGERLLVCTDGINSMIGDRVIEQLLRAARPARDTSEALVAAALAAGGRDNATAVVVDVVGWVDS